MPPVLVRPYVRVIAHHQIPPAAYPNRTPVATRPEPPEYRARHAWAAFVHPAHATAPRPHRAPPERRTRHYPALAWTVLILTLATTGLALMASDRAATSADAEPHTAANAGRLQMAIVPAPTSPSTASTAPSTASTAPSTASTAAPAAAPPVASTAVSAGPLVGPAGLCLDARAGGSVQLRRCTGAATQTWSAPADGTLRTAGRCLQQTSGRLGLARCTGADAQRWETARGALVARTSRQCLTGRGNSQPYLARCAAGVESQRWLLP